MEHVICHVQKLTNLSRECSNARNYKRDHLLVTCKTTNVKSHILESAIRSIFRRFNSISHANKHNNFGKTFFLVDLHAMFNIDGYDLDYMLK